MNSHLEGLIKKFKNSKEAKNASWLIGGKIIQMLLSLIVGILTARFLGPSNYGVVNYGAAYVAFFTSVCSLGINSIIVKNFFDHPEEEGETIGTAILLKFISSSLSCFLIFLIVSIVDAGEKETILVVVLCSLSLVFHILDTLNYWFQSRYQSKRCAIATLVAYVVTSIYKIVLLATQKSVAWFAFANSVDYIIYAIVIVFFFKRANGPKFSASLRKAKQLLSTSYHFVLSGVMIALYGYINRIMLKQMVGSAEVGYFSVATSVCMMWTFVLQAIIDSFYPSIMQFNKTDKRAFDKKNRQLYAIVFYTSIAVSVAFTIFGDIAIKILYGDAYIPAITPLKIVTWYTAFSYLGQARDAWVVCNNAQRNLKYMYLGAVVVNVILNFVLIPRLGASGAALASFITQVCTSLVLPCMFKEMRGNVRLMLQAITLRDVYK